MNNGKQIPTNLELEEPEDSFDVEQLLFVLREKVWLIAGCCFLGVIAGLAYIHHTPLTYYAQAVIQVDPEPLKVVDSEVQQPTDPISEEMGQTLLALFRNRSFVQEVIQDNHLMDDPDFAAPQPNGKPPTIDQATGALIGMSHASIRSGTRFIDIGVQHRDPRIAKIAANAIAETFIHYMVVQHEKTAKVAIDYLADEAKATAAKLHASDTTLVDYEEKNDTMSLHQNQDTVISELKNQTTQLDIARATRLKLEADEENAKKNLNDPDALLQIPSVADYPTIVEGKKQVAALESQIVARRLRWTDKHPGMILLQTQLADARKVLIQNVLNMPPIIHSSYEAAVDAEKKFKIALQEQEKLAMALNRKSIEYNVLLRDRETDQALYESTLARLKQVKLASGIESTNVHIFEYALIPTDPTQARKTRTLAMSLAGGLLLGIGLSFGLNWLDKSVKTVDQAEQLLGIPVLAAIPRQPQNKLDGGSFSMVKDQSSVVAEAFRSLRTAIHLAGRNKGRKVVLFTSALAAEGKTFCSINYATALAQQGLKTLLIDADLRAPMIGSLLLPGQKSPGLTGLLSKQAEPDQTISASDTENLSLLVAGDLVPNPAELLAQADLGNIISRLIEKFDRIVIDTAPVNAVSDTLLLVENTQVCLVVRAGKTPRKWILRAMKILTEAGSKPSGLVLNQIPMHMASACSYYPGTYGEPGVYGSNDNGPHKRLREKVDPLVTEPPAGR
jgi:capsular exopolysaccharide synthesis family protein